VKNILKSRQIDLNNTKRFLDSEEITKKYKHFLIDEGDLVIASSGISIDKDQLLRTRGAFIEKEHLPICLNTSTIRFKSKEGISSLHFLKHWFDSYSFRAQITREVTGIAQKNFGPSHLKRLKIPLPPLPEQKRIAAILDKADALREKRRQAIAKLDELLQSVFLDMFGDPVSNPKGWEVVKIENICSNIIDCPHSTPKYSEKKTSYACIRSSDIQNGFLDFSTTKYVSEKEFEKRIKRLKPRQNDIVYCREGARFGNAALIQDETEICLGQRMMLFRINVSISAPEYLWGYFQCKSVYLNAVKLSGGSASPHINVKEIKSSPIPLPPIEKQKRYSEIIKSIIEKKETFAQQFKNLDTLFAALQQRAFKGEL